MVVLPERNGLLSSAELLDELLTDLLTFRADRDRYYDCADELFNRYPDIVLRLVSNTPSLIPNCSRA